ncbi:MAG: molybdenum hydroxylase [Acidobacteria bacterium]|nr:MAG: molybdenum hydroxylase [Acidobacteriota bacterium]
MRDTRILIKGAGEQATGTAHRLFRCGFKVVMTELAQPTMVRRTVSFGQAMYDGSCEVEGVAALKFEKEGIKDLDQFDWNAIPVFADPDGRLITQWNPHVIIDARILKYNHQNCKDQAELVIGLGPGIEAGRDVDIVIETQRGHGLGQIIESGFTQENTGIPGDIGRQSIRRVLRSPRRGVFKSDLNIGDLVQAGQLIGYVDSEPVHAELTGVLRGLIVSGLQVSAGMKIGDIDPRSKVEACYTLSDKARTISGSVLEVILVHLNRANKGSVRHA